MLKDTDLEIPYLVGLLKINNEKAYQDLSKEIYGKEDGFELGALLKDQGDGIEAEAPREGINIEHRARIAYTSLKEMDPSIEPIISSLRAKLIFSSRFGYLSEIVAAIGAGLALLMERTGWGGDVLLSVSILITFLGTIFSITSRFFSQDIFEINGDLSSTYNQALKFRYDSKTIIEKFEILFSYHDSSRRLSYEQELVKEAEELAKSIYMLTFK